jgi:Transglycosylase SLT domain
MAVQEGYQVGTAWVQVLPSFNSFHKRVASAVSRIGDVTIRGDLDLDTTKAEATARAAESGLIRRPIVAKLDLDRRTYDAKMAKLLAERDEKLMHIDAEISAYEAKIVALKRKPERTDIDVDAEVAKYEARIRALTAKREHVNVDVDVKADRAERGLNRVENHLRRLGNSQTDINMEAGDASRVIALTGAIITGLTVVSQLAPAAAAAVALIPGALEGAAQGVTALVGGLQGVGTAVKALQAAEDDATLKADKNSAARLDAIDRVASANESLQAAQDSANRAAIQGAQQVKEAQDAVGEAQQNAARRVADAEHSVTDAEESLARAQAAARDTQKSLTQAREDAKARLDDMRTSLKGAALDEQAAVLRVQQAQADLAEARKKGVKGLDLAQLTLGVRQAVQNLAEVRNRYRDLKTEARRANKAGVAGSDEVVAAQQKIADAQQNVKDSAAKVGDAEKNLNDARAQGALDVAKAQARAGIAQQQASWAAADAARQLVSAQRAAANASRDAVGKSSTAMDKAALAMSKLTPAGQHFATFLQGTMKPALRDIGGAIQTAMLPRLEEAFSTLLRDAPLFRTALARTGDTLGQIAKAGATMVTSGPWRHDFARITDNSNRSIANLSVGGLNLLDAMRNLTVAGAPMQQAVTGGFAVAMAKFRDFIQVKRDSGELDKWFAEMTQRLKDFWGTVKGMAEGIWSVMKAIAPLGKLVLDTLGPLLKAVGNLAQLNPVLTTMVVTLGVAGSAFVSFFRGLGGLRQAVNTARDVKRSIGGALFGVRDAAHAATGEVDAFGRQIHTTGSVVEGNRGAIGRFKDGLRGIASTYRDARDQTAQYLNRGRSFGSVTATAAKSAEQAAEGLGKWAGETDRWNVSALVAKSRMGGWAAEVGKWNVPSLVAKSNLQKITGAAEDFNATAARHSAQLRNLATATSNFTKGLSPNQLVFPLTDLERFNTQAARAKTSLDNIGTASTTAATEMDVAHTATGRFAGAVPILGGNLTRAGTSAQNAGGELGALATHAGDARGAVNKFNVETLLAKSNLSNARTKAFDASKAIHGVGTAGSNAETLLGGFRGTLLRGATQLSETELAAVRFSLGVRDSTALAADWTTVNMGVLRRALLTTEGALGAFAVTTQGAMTRAAGAARGAAVSIAASMRGAATAAAGGLTRALGGLWGIIGGWPGLIVTGITVGLGFLASSQEDAAQAAADHAAKISDLTEKLRENHGVLSEELKVDIAGDLRSRKVLDNAKHFGIGIKNLIDDIGKGAGANTDYGKSMDLLRVQFERTGNMEEASRGNFEGILRQVKKNGGGYRDYSAQVEHLLDTMETEHHMSKTVRDSMHNELVQLIDLQGAVTDISGPYKVAQANQDAYTQALKDAGLEIDTTTGKIRAIKDNQPTVDLAVQNMATALSDLGDDAKTSAEKVDALATAIDNLESDRFEPQQAKKAVNDAFRSVQEFAAGLKQGDKAIDINSLISGKTGLIDTQTAAGSNFEDQMMALKKTMDHDVAAAYLKVIKAGGSEVDALKAGQKAAQATEDRFRSMAKQLGIQPKLINKMVAAYDLTPAVVQTIVSAPGMVEVTLKALGLSDAITAIPNDHQVIINDNSPATIKRLHDLGFTVKTMPDGQIEVTANTKAARDDIAAVNKAADDAAKKKHIIEMQVAVDIENYYESHGPHPLTPEEIKARKKLLDAATAIENYYMSFGPNPPTPDQLKARGGPSNLPRATGGIDEYWAAGGMRPMGASRADIVGSYTRTGTQRVIGDHPTADEAFIPLQRTKRNIAILAEAARRLGYGLVPMALGAIMRMAGGGVLAAPTPVTAPTAPSTGASALTLDPAAIAAFTGAVTDLTAALDPLAKQINTVTAPALELLETHTGTLLVRTLGALSNTWADTWPAMAKRATTNVAAIDTQLAALRTGLDQTRSAFANTASSINTEWSKIPRYTGDPVRDAITGPIDGGLIFAWNYLNTFFALGKPLKPIMPAFATGGRVPGSGSGDIVPAMLTPGEYVISKPVVQKWGLRNIHAAHLAARRGGFPGLEGMFAGDGNGIFRVGYASGGPVPEALARAEVFGRSMDHKPYIWGGSSEAGTDCSGWMAMLARSLLDVKPYARREWSTSVAAGGNPPPRFAKGIQGLFAIGVNPYVHTAGTLAGRNMESGGAHNYVAFGPPSTGADDPQFPYKFHLPELGGKFVSGGTGEFSLSEFIQTAFSATAAKIGRLKDVWGQQMMAQMGAAMAARATDALVRMATSTISPEGVAGDVESWRPLVVRALKMLHLPLAWADITLTRMAQESGGNPRAVNLWDSNAQRGDPSKGLMQVIGSTFAAFRDTRAADDVYDPLANLLASMRYAMHRYHSLPAAYGRAGGYDNGGWLPPGYSTVFNGLGRPEAVLTPNQWNAVVQLADQRSAPGVLHGDLYLSSGEFLGHVRGEIQRANDHSSRVLARRSR